MNLNLNFTDIGHQRSLISPTPNIIPVLFGFGKKITPKWRLAILWGGCIKNVMDQDIYSTVKEITGPWTSSASIVCPADPCETMNITLPFLFMVVKNMNKGFAFEVHILDDKGQTREFYVTNNRSMAHWSIQRCFTPLRLDHSWNKITLDLAHHTRTLFNSEYVQTQRLKIYANCRLRQIYFADRIYANQEYPDGYKVHLPFCKANTSIFLRGRNDKE